MRETTNYDLKQPEYTDAIDIEVLNGNSTIIDTILKQHADAIDQGGGGGTPGYSPTVTITDITGGHRVTITDINGAHTFDVMDGEDGQDGATGATGPQGQPGQKGDTGATGPAGQNGTDGTDGVSPTVTITTITGGHRVTITDVDGSHSFDVLDGADGQDGQDGQDGATGATGPQGPAGADGNDGKDGQDGADGYSPTVSITTITGGHRVTITDVNGSHSFDVMDGTSTSGGGATVLYETTNPTQLDKSSGGTSSITLTTALTAADPQAVIVWVSTNDYDAPKIPIVIPRPDGGWTYSSYAGIQIWANATDFGYSAGLGSAQNLFKVKLLGNSDYISLSALDPFVPGLDIWSDGQGGYTGVIDWSTSLSTYTPRLYIWKVVGV